MFDTFPIEEEASASGPHCYVMKFVFWSVFFAVSGVMAAGPTAAPLIVPVVTAGAGWQFTAMQPDGKLLINGAFFTEAGNKLVHLTLTCFEIAD